MNTESVEILGYLLQTVSSGLLLTCLWVARTIWVKVQQLEENQTAHRLELERKISALELATTTRIVKLERGFNE